MSLLDEALAAGCVSRMEYLWARMRQAEADADRIIVATPQAQRARLELAYDQRFDNRPKPIRKYHE
jgi:hypothetical protein